MAIAIYFHPEKLNEQQYRAVLDQLTNDGHWPPAGLRHHSCFGEADNLMVYEVWENQQALEAFGQHLMPVLQQNQINTGQPDIMPVVNVTP